MINCLLRCPPISTKIETARGEYGCGREKSRARRNTDKKKGLIIQGCKRNNWMPKDRGEDNESETGSKGVRGVFSELFNCG